MDVVMIPGFWLGGESWGEAAEAVRAAGHAVHTPTLAGLGSAEDDRSGVTLASHVAEVVALVDAIAAGQVERGAAVTSPGERVPPPGEDVGGAPATGRGASTGSDATDTRDRAWAGGGQDDTGGVEGTGGGDGTGGDAADTRDRGGAAGGDGAIGSGGSGEGGVVLVGHSGGGSVIHAVADARPRLVRRAVYVDSWPTADGIAVNAELPTEGDDVPLPGWEAFGEEDLRDFTDETRAHFRAIAVPEPVRVARDPQRLSNPERFAVPVTLIASTFTEDELQGYIASGHPYFAEFPHLESLTVIELPTGHWPQFTRPRALGAALVEAIDAG